MRSFQSLAVQFYFIKEILLHHDLIIKSMTWEDAFSCIVRLSCSLHVCCIIISPISLFPLKQWSSRQLTAVWLSLSSSTLVEFPVSRLLHSQMLLKSPLKQHRPSLVIYSTSAVILYCCSHFTPDCHLKMLCLRVLICCVHLHAGLGLDKGL